MELKRARYVQAPPPDASFRFEVETVLGRLTESPLVCLTWKGDKVVISVDQAHTIALQILDVCHASITDAALWHFAREKLGLNPEAAGSIISELRGYRAALAERKPEG